MKTLMGSVAGLGIVLSLSLAFANPALLPKHPGYPGGNAVSPVTGQPLANDAGQTNASGEKALLQSAETTGTHAVQNLQDHNNMRVVEKQGAGRLPKVQGPQITIEPPVKEATRMPK
ncbi:MAG: hypothetical protein C4293_10245 [Nitrospiraceae bacterium]